MVGTSCDDICVSEAMAKAMIHEWIGSDFSLGNSSSSDEEWKEILSVDSAGNAENVALDDWLDHLRLKRQKQTMKNHRCLRLWIPPHVHFHLAHPELARFDQTWMDDERIGARALQVQQEAESIGRSHRSPRYYLLVLQNQQRGK